jgi:trehalose 6-phosphate synthase
LAPANLKRVGTNTNTQLYPLVVLSNRLPVVSSLDESGNPVSVLSPGGLVAAVAPALTGKGAAWVGWSGDDNPEASPTVVDGITIIPVPLAADLAMAHYEGYSNSTLWPLFHQVGVECQQDPTWFEAHREVNERFAKAVAQCVEPGGMVWVHDYQVMLAPQLIRALRPDVRIGYFHHIPFPSPAALHELAEWQDIISGLSHAGVIGFQRTGDGENFEAALAELNGTRGVTSPLVKAYPISIDYPSVSEAAATAGVHEKAREFRETLGGNRRILLGIDRLDYTKGIPERLEAFSALLDSGEISVEEVVFVQAGSPSRENVEAYVELQDRVDTLATQINARHSSVDGHLAVWYAPENMEREDMLALFVAGDVMVVSSLRDGMNLVAKEYVACKADNQGVLVLSIYTGAADHMTEAILVDPTKPEELQAALLAALRMPPEEAASRMSMLRKQVKDHDVARWAQDFLADLASSLSR